MNYLVPFFRGVALLVAALLFPVLVFVVFAPSFLGGSVSDPTAWILWVIGVGEPALLAIAAVQWRRAWALSHDQPRRMLLVAVSVSAAVLVLARVVVFILSNLRTNCCVE